MRKLGFIAVLVLVTAFGCGLKSKSKAATEYNNKIVNTVDVVNAKYLEFAKSLLNLEIDKAERKLQEVDEASSNAIAKLDQMKSFDGDNKFKIAAMNYMLNARRITNNELREMIDIMKKLKSGEVSRPDEIQAVTKRAAELDQQIKQSDAKWSSEYFEAQKEFAKKYKFRLETNSLNDETEELKKELEELEEQNNQVQ